MTTIAAYQIIDLSRYSNMDEISAELGFDSVFDSLHGGGTRAQRESCYKFRLTPDRLSDLKEAHVHTLTFLSDDPEATDIHNEKYARRQEMISAAINEAGSMPQPGLIYHLIRIKDPSVGDILREKLPRLGYIILEDKI